MPAYPHARTIPNMTGTTDPPHADPDPLVRLTAATNPATPPHILTKLAADTNPNIRAAVALHLNTPTGTLRTLCADTDTNVADLANYRRRDNLDTYIATLTGADLTHAQLLAPTFTGWPHDLHQILTSLHNLTDPG